MLIIVALSITLRAPALNRPLGDGHQWLTSTVLRTQQIWNRDGITHWHFLPVMSYELQADKNIANQASLNDAKGNWYYTSYGSLSYIVPYLIQKAIAQPPSAQFLGWFNIALQIATALLLYALVVEITRPKRFIEYTPAFAAFAVYMLTPETLWFHSNPYMADMFVQPLFVLGALLFLKYLRSETSIRHATLLAIIITLAVCSEWLGLFLAVAICLYAMVAHRDGQARRLALASAGGAAAGVAIILWHYSTINGLDAFLHAAGNKYESRSGASTTSAFKLTQLRGWLEIASTYWRGYWPILATLPILASTFTWKRTKKWSPALFVIIVPILLHHVIFFDFTAEHPFSALKTGILAAILAAMLAEKAISADSDIRKNPALAAAIATAILLIYPLGVWLHRQSTGAASGHLRPIQIATILGSALIVIALARRNKTNAPARSLAILLAISTAGSAIGYSSIERSARNPSYQTKGSFIAQNARPNEVVFIADDAHADYPALPMTVLYAHRNLAEWHGPDSANTLLLQNHTRNGVLFHFALDGTPQVTRFRIQPIR